MEQFPFGAAGNPASDSDIQRFIDLIINDK